MISLTSLFFIGFLYYVATNPVLWVLGAVVGAVVLFILSPTFRFIVTFGLASIIYLAWVFTA
jgi:hypothetical protein